MASNQYRVGIIGGGAWGTALSIIANRSGSATILGTRNVNVSSAIREHRANDIYLPGIYMDPAIQVTDNLAKACVADVVIIAVPSQVVRSALISISDSLDETIPVVLASKGIERGNLLFMSELAATILPKNPIAVISGPNFADEAARGLPTATTIACADERQWDTLSYALGGRLFRPYMTTDVIGTQIGGTVKNVIAIACGIATGRELGENARAALITRGFAEMARLAQAKGARYETLMGLSGLGDLILTCGSMKSRNMSFGMQIGQGKSAESILAARGRSATEGVVAAESIGKLAHKLGVKMPIADAVYQIIYEQADVNQVIQALLERPFSSESAQ